MRNNIVWSTKWKENPGAFFYSHNHLEGWVYTFFHCTWVPNLQSHQNPYVKINNHDKLVRNDQQSYILSCFEFHLYPIFFLMPCLILQVNSWYTIYISSLCFEVKAPSWYNDHHLSEGDFLRPSCFGWELWNEVIMVLNGWKMDLQGDCMV